MNLCLLIYNSKKTKLIISFYRDVRSVTGANLRKMMLDYNVLCIDHLSIPKDQRMFPVPEEEKWRGGITSEVIDALNNAANISEFDHYMLCNLLNDLCTN